MITVLSSVCGKKDKIEDTQTKGNAKWLLYLDDKYDSPTWDVRPAYDRFKDPRRNSRAPKILSHLFCDTEYSIWIDGNMSLTRPPGELVERLLGDHDMAVFKHPKRDCIYDEALRVAKLGLDDPEVIIQQVSRYEREGYAKHKGLFECGFLIRRHTKKVKEFNAMWWAEYTRGCVRDQVSFAYAVDSVGLRINAIDAPWYLASDGINAFRDDFIEIRPHLILNPKL